MQPIKHKKYIIISFVVACILLILQAIIFWNTIAIGCKQSTGILPFLILIVALLALGYMFSIFLKTTDTTQIEADIEKKVAEEKEKLIKELEKTEVVEQNDNEEEFIENKVKDLIPKGNFKSYESLIDKYLKNLASAFEIVVGIAYVKEKEKNEYVFSTGYALTGETNPLGFKSGETLPGQVTDSGAIIYLNDIPENYFTVISGLGQSKPKQLIFIPLFFENEIISILEFATFKPIEGNNKKIIEQSAQNISLKITQTIKS